MSDYFTCPICQEIPDPKFAVQCRGCRTVFCDTCAHEWSKVSTECAHCREVSGYTEADKAIQRVLGDIEVDCPYACGKKTTKSELEDHCRLCPKKDATTIVFPKVNRHMRAEILKGDSPGATGGSPRSAETGDARPGPSRARQQPQEEQCESSGFAESALLVAAVGGALVGVVGGVIGTLIAKRKKSND